MLRVSFLIFFILIASLALAQEKKENSEPIIITSQTLVNDSKTKTATFDGNVVAKRADMTMQANRMIVYYEDEKQGGKIRMIEVIGNVRVTKAKRLITSEKAIYYPEPEERVEFIGEPRATDGRNLIIGEKIIYYVKDDRSVVEKSKVYLKEKKE